ncbi:Integrase catalytic domain-containing protein [Aphis craccivora]|uniref:Integrase catalytic domain-containing protein n=1 Tax=Aphis craccivora TaxID=307492 RepID=A0A6G0WPS2_APHCR|nr:Integrase catalytic domain-containing protein [Aphis craccivora]
MCKTLQKESPETFNTTCGNFALTASSLLQEISRKRSNMLQSIDIEEINKREKRGLINLVRHIQKTLFGTLDDEYGEMYNTQIRELQSSRVGLLKIVDKQSSILKLTNSVFKEAQLMENQIRNLNITCNNLETNLKRVWYQIDVLEIRTTITNLITTLLLLLQQLVFKTDLVGEIISAAQNGIIHSGIISTRELRIQLRDILISLPRQLKLPFDVNYISLYELSKISKLAIVYMNGTLVFELVIPLLSPVELTLYHIIPLPVRK